ncbi:cell division protein ZipA [Pseudomonas ficuserectae]|uniref:Cell division protein ZipA n=2 Tax=Pseudomonas amygdali pv. lachrymans TaxID=53707 RepID=A0AB37RET8_PSEAV|nr:cell division protein ZipA [Pseudomonas amygdali]ARA81902.1 cell division protein ZipA [Pseudomonas amygdali pv. lachrymans]AXH55177.1 cell division protein ZipA [Pseudomonas amygdali pv. lachrymans str. M301315]KKY58988.1 cell division protein ZipA [Pseudomonas amygdali pv. lachrymans]KPB97149.1 Cell division protein ZipA -like protein [Pseudomonas amygdali pv. lachrymans]KPC14377.1 Cell division protein ZipA -like protein [Pseudomonas amygdali pv. lachrymans]
MEIGLREWLIVIGIIVIAGILFDGWRRMRGSKGKLKFRLDRSFSNLPDEEETTSAEVLGPPRVLDTHKEPQLDEHDLPSMSASPREGKRSNSDKRGNSDKKRKDEPQQGDLNLDLDGPSLFTGRDDDFPDDKPAQRITEDKDLPPVEEVLVISVISRSEGGFKGPALLQNILESGLRFGEMDIFHRHESMAGNGEVLFSMANAVKPGVFDLDDIDHFSTRAVSFFLGLPGPRYPKQAFDVMVAAARKLAHELDGELKDDQRSVMTAQTIEHYRQRIVEFERRALTQRRG